LRNKWVQIAVNEDKSTHVVDPFVGDSSVEFSVDVDTAFVVVVDGGGVVAGVVVGVVVETVLLRRETILLVIN
jgi:hypothetical protein